MPSIINLQNLTKKNIFKKKQYRPWDETVELDITEQKLNNFKVEDKEKNLKKDQLLNIKSKNDLDLSKELLNFYGAKKTIMKFLLSSKAEDKVTFFITKVITMKEIEDFCKIPSNTIKATIQELKKKQLIFAYDNKPGRGGYARYGYLKELYDFFIKSL